MSKLKRIVAEIDFSALDYEDLHAVTGALVTLEKLANRGIISFNTTEVRGLAKRRADALELHERAIHPQTKIVFEYLEKHPTRKFTAKEIADATGVSDNGIRAQLHQLLSRRLVNKEDGDTCDRGSKHGATPNLWSLAR